MQRDETVPSLVQEARGAAWGLSALLRYKPDWSLGFDPSAQGFVRSFLAQLVALPFYLITAAMLARTSTPPGGPATLWAAGIAELTDAVAFPLVVAAIARPLGIGAGYCAFIIVINWLSLFLNLALGLASLATLLGQEGIAVFSTIAIALFALSVVMTWRAAKETLTHETAPALLMVVLSVAVGVLCDNASLRIVSLFG